MRSCAIFIIQSPVHQTFKNYFLFRNHSKDRWVWRNVIRASRYRSLKRFDHLVWEWCSSALLRLGERHRALTIRTVLHYHCIFTFTNGFYKCRSSSKTCIRLVSWSAFKNNSLLLSCSSGSIFSPGAIGRHSQHIVGEVDFKSAKVRSWFLMISKTLEDGWGYERLTS